jgi:hypothetical protein
MPPLIAGGLKPTLQLPNSVLVGKKREGKIRLIVSDRKRSGVSGSIRSIKMYSCAQCSMQEKSACCRYVPCLVHMEQGPGPLHPEHLPPSLSAWVLGTQSTSSSLQGWTWTVQWTRARSLTQTLWPSENVC